MNNGGGSEKRSEFIVAAASGMQAVHSFAALFWLTNSYSALVHARLTHNLNRNFV